MTPERIRERIEEIKAVADDHEQAHKLEKELWFDVLLAISEGVDEARGIATEALETIWITFHRWYA